MHKALSTFQEPFSDPKSDIIYLRKIAVEIAVEICRL